MTGKVGVLSQSQDGLERDKIWEREKVYISYLNFGLGIEYHKQLYSE